jgi:hypothetical protein
MKAVSIITISLLIIFFSCKKTKDDSDLVINAGFVCGWGAGMDSIKITQKAIQYVSYIPARSSTPVINKNRAVSEGEWQDILNVVNTDDFLSLNYNSCNICFDGCDEWISVQNDRISHKITYGKGTSIDSISGLQDKIAQLRAEFSK